MKITFLGATGEVTGSKYLVQEGSTNILVDCGIFQGRRETRKHNWDPFEVDPTTIQAIVLTHAHLDHSGYIPALYKKGFRGKVYCSKATYQLCTILLQDSGAIQEEDATHTNKTGKSRHKPALPLYTLQDAKESLTFFHGVEYDVEFAVGSLKITLIRSGHILGASFVIVSNGRKTITFSGDLGREDQPIMQTPAHIKKADYLVLESTYGDRIHEQGDPLSELADIVNKTVANAGKLIIPAFAVGRTQMILYYLYQLLQKNSIPKVPIFLDSPMAINVTDLYCKFKQEHRLSSQVCEQVFGIATYTRTTEESKLLAHIKEPVIIIAGSGMAAGGRVLHHLKNYISDKKNAVLFVGFQAYGTKGRYLVDGDDKIKIHGSWYPVHATIEKIDILSAHADSEEILTWLGYFEHAPEKTFLIHGEQEARQALKQKIEQKLGWSVVMPNHAESFDL